MRGGTEIKHLRCPGFDPQLVSHVDEDGFSCLKFTEDTKSKTNQGGVKRRAHNPKSVHIYPNNENVVRCPV